jgi:(2Fe-2S) ferredoxin
METEGRAEHWAFVCESSTCHFQGSAQTREALARAVAERGDPAVHVVRTGCLGLCGAGPAVVTYPAGDVLLRVQPGDAPELAAALAGGTGLGRRLVRAPPWYRERITARLALLVRLLRRRGAAGARPSGA